MATQCSECAEDREVAVLALARGAAASPGSRLLHGFVTSWKYEQRVRWSRFPPTVARLRSWPEAPASSACESTG